MVRNERAHPSRAVRGYSRRSFPRRRGHGRAAWPWRCTPPFCRWVTDAELKPGVELSHPGGQSAPAFAAAFGCMPRFGAAENALVFAAADTTRPLPTSNDRLSAVHDRMATEHLEGMSGSLVKTRARAIIAGRLPDGAPTRGAIARALGTSERTLHRRLVEEGTSFLALVDETRRELAENYLVRRDLSLATIAYMLGFKDQGGFFRAAQRWLSMTPTQYRQRAASADRLTGDKARAPTVMSLAPNVRQQVSAKDHLR
jgi:AraC-like DNA-binding protein